MGRGTTTRRHRTQRAFLRADGGQSLIEIALVMPVLILLMGYAIDFSYFFMAAATITSSARNATQYSVLGYQGPAQSVVPAAGPASTTSSVTALALADLASLFNSATTTSVQVCSKNLGMNGTRPVCGTYGQASATTYTPGVDPEAPRFVMHRVDITYTVTPPVPMTFFKMSLLPNLTFHRQVSMRAMD